MSWIVISKLIHQRDQKRNCWRELGRFIDTRGRQNGKRRIRFDVKTESLSNGNESGLRADDGLPQKVAGLRKEKWTGNNSAIIGTKDLNGLQN